MLGTILFSSKVRYGQNKRNISYYLFIPDDNGTKYIVASKKGRSTKVDHYAKIEILDNECTPPKGAIQILFGEVNDPKVCLKYSLYKYNILPKQNIKVEIVEDKSTRLDLTKENVFSIDPEETKDIDDAFHFKFNDDILELGIHITDLSNFNIQDINTLSEKFSTFYFNNFLESKNITLFDESICDSSNSLIQGEERNCISLMIKFNKEITYNFRKTTIINKNKISYDNADKLMVEKDNFIKLKSTLESYWGEIKDSHELIEKLMIFYNNKMAEHLMTLDNDFPIRVHQGINLDLHERYKKSSYSLDASLFKKICYHSAEYVNAKTCDNPKHFGLDIELYSHATSPLRRVPDIIIQKIFTNQEHYDIEKICEIFNQRSFDFKGAYRDVNKIKLVQEMKSDSKRIFDAIVTNFSEGQIITYIPELDIIHPINIPNKLKDIINIELDDVHIKISHIQSGEQIELELLQNIKINVMITPFEHNMNKKIRLFLEEPNLIDIFE